MARKKIKLITFDLDDTVWPNHKVIIDAEKALWNFLLMKVPQLKNDISEESINRIRVQLVEKDNSLKFDLTKFRKEVVKELLLKIGLDENEAIYYSNESFNEFFRAGFPMMLLTTAIISLYMVLVYAVGGGGMQWKLVLVGISLVGIIYQVYRGKSKGKNLADSLVDHDYEELKDLAGKKIQQVKSAVTGASEAE